MDRGLPKPDLVCFVEPKDDFGSETNSYKVMMKRFSLLQGEHWACFPCHAKEDDIIQVIKSEILESKRTDLSKLWKRK